MRFFRRIALVKFMTSPVGVVARKSRALVCAIALLALILPASTLANGLRIGVRIQGELNSPLVPVTRNFKTCISVDEKGVPVVSLCTTEALPTRKPAEKPEKSGEKPLGIHPESIIK